MMKITDLDATALERLQSEMRNDGSRSPHFDPLIEKIADATLHYDGYVRERALKKLCSLEEEAAIPFLFLRLIDNVLPIRRLAALELIKRLVSKHAECILRQVSFWTKIKLRASIPKYVIDAVESYLKQDKAAKTLFIQNFDHVDRFTKRCFFPYILDNREIDLVTFLLRCFRDQDVKIKFLALQDYKKLAATPLEAARLYKEMASNPFMPVRREALLLAVESKQLPPEEVWFPALMDPHLSIRELAQYHLRQKGKKIADIYRMKISENADPIAILGLGESGTAEDIPLIARFLNSTSSAILQASMRSLNLLGFNFELTTLYDLLAHPSSKVGKEAYKLLSKKQLDRNELIETYLKSSLRIKRQAVLLSQRLSKWDRIYFLLVALPSHQDPTLGVLADRAMDRWYRNDYPSLPPPSPTQINELKELIEKVKNPSNTFHSLTDLLEFHDKIAKRADKK